MNSIYRTHHKLVAGLVLLGVLIYALFGEVSNAYAVNGGGDQCVNCHRSQYHNYDNGKSFCLDESPMRCVDCHGGNPFATTKSQAHYDRSAHPVINEDVSRCYVCHLDDADANLSTFKKVAGLSSVHVEGVFENADTAYAGFPDLETPQPAPLRAGSVGIAIGLGLTVLIIRKQRSK